MHPENGSRKSDMVPGDNQSKDNKKARQKKRILMGMGALCVVGLVSAVCLQNPQWFEVERETSTGPTSMYSDRLVSYAFYPTDYDLDVTADETYMGLDRYVYFKNGNETIAITDGDYAAYNKAVEFFGTYFETVIAGDWETYNTFFSEPYYETHEPMHQFAPQMLYDIRIEMLSQDPQNDGSTLYAFNVEYKIHRNDGTFRNDIGSDASKKLYFELYEDRDGVVLIDRVTYYVR